MSDSGKAGHSNWATSVGMTHLGHRLCASQNPRLVLLICATSCLLSPDHNPVALKECAPWARAQAHPVRDIGNRIAIGVNLEFVWRLRRREGLGRDGPGRGLGDRRVHVHNPGSTLPASPRLEKRIHNPGGRLRRGIQSRDRNNDATWIPLLHFPPCHGNQSNHRQRHSRAALQPRRRPCRRHHGCAQRPRRVMSLPRTRSPERSPHVREGSFQTNPSSAHGM